MPGDTTIEGSYWKMGKNANNLKYFESLIVWKKNNKNQCSLFYDNYYRIFIASLTKPCLKTNNKRKIVFHNKFSFIVYKFNVIFKINETILLNFS